jgi:hypothetical protein
VDNLNARGIVTVPFMPADEMSRAGSPAGRTRPQAGERRRPQRAGFECRARFRAKTRQFIRATAAVNSFETNLVVAKSSGWRHAVEVGRLDVEVRLAQARRPGSRPQCQHSWPCTPCATCWDRRGEFSWRTPLPSSARRTQEISHAGLAAARERESTAQAQLRGTKSGYQPRISAFGSLDYDYGWVTGGDGKSYTAGVMAQWDLWDGFSTRAKVREAKANLESAHEEQRKLRLALNLEVEQARLDLNTAAERLVVSGKTVEQAAESASLTRNRFEQGLALSTQLIDSETALVAARVRRAEAESDERIAIAALRKALAYPTGCPAGRQ